MSKIFSLRALLKKYMMLLLQVETNPDLHCLCLLQLYFCVDKSEAGRQSR